MDEISNQKDAAAVIETTTHPSLVDAAWKYLDSHHENATHRGALELKALRRKIDWHIVPLAFLRYTVQFVDKVLLNVSRLLFFIRVIYEH